MPNERTMLRLLTREDHTAEDECRRHLRHIWDGTPPESRFGEMFRLVWRATCEAEVEARVATRVRAANFWLLALLLGTWSALVWSLVWL